MTELHIRNVIEAALLAAGKSLQVTELVELFDEDGSRPTVPGVQAALAALAEEYATRGIEIKETAAGFRIQVRRELANEISRLWPERPAKYSRAYLETLALIAYRQPITRAEIEAVRGVAVNPNILKTVIERNWVRVVGHRDVPGRPELLGTTRDFLDYFGLKSLDELPPLAELKSIGEIKVQFDLPDPGQLALDAGLADGAAPGDATAAGPEGSATADSPESVNVDAAANGETAGADANAPAVGDAFPDGGVAPVAAAESAFAEEGSTAAIANASVGAAESAVDAADTSIGGAETIATVADRSVGGAETTAAFADRSVGGIETTAADANTSTNVAEATVALADTPAGVAVTADGTSTADGSTDNAVAVGDSEASKIQASHDAPAVSGAPDAVSADAASTRAETDEAVVDRDANISSDGDPTTAAPPNASKPSGRGSSRKKRRGKGRGSDTARHDAEEFAASVDADLAGDEDSSDEDELSAAGPDSSELVAGPRDIDD